MPMSDAATPEAWQNVANARHHALFGRGRRGEDLDGGAPAAVLERKVGEGAADIDGQPSRRHPVLGLMGRAGSEPAQAGRGKLRSAPHCEERSDAAISVAVANLTEIASLRSQ